MKTLRREQCLFLYKKQGEDQMKEKKKLSLVIYALSDFLIMILSWLVKQSLRAFLFQEVQP